MSALFDAKTLEFSKFMVCPHGHGELIQCGHFADKERGSILCGHLLSSSFGPMLYRQMLSAVVLSLFTLSLSRAAKPSVLLGGWCRGQGGALLLLLL